MGAVNFLTKSNHYSTVVWHEINGHACFVADALNTTGQLVLRTHCTRAHLSQDLSQIFNERCYSQWTIEFDSRTPPGIFQILDSDSREIGVCIKDGDNDTGSLEGPQVLMALCTTKPTYSILLGNKNAEELQVVLVVGFEEGSHTYVRIGVGEIVYKEWLRLNPREQQITLV